MSEERYVLATGAKGADRLRVLHRVHGGDTQDLFRRIGVREGMRVADFGCGIGMISCDLARWVGETGEVVGIDRSAGQIAEAQKNAEALELKNVRFVVASAYDTGLEREAYDVAYCRFLLMHLREPEKAIAEMLATLKPGGVLALEDGDFSSPCCYPRSLGIERLMALYRRAGEAHNEDFEIGKRLHTLAIEAGLKNVEARLAQPAYVSGEEKRLPSWTLEETAESLIEQGIATQEEIASILEEVYEAERDENTLMLMARVTQVWARK